MVSDMVGWLVDCFCRFVEGRTFQLSTVCENKNGMKSSHVETTWNYELQLTHYQVILVISRLERGNMSCGCGS
ncbi:hypothetical protein CEXT_194071 [Caerostris extrusa]|uniref:Uncharacterized protein n=1 Tax=Caerostris extrusa TaxID=172846 RepID=A0AAV4TZQ3_CAEEX|nr:hypothetical protein CEXT_194071 [Caerostris extrusa]